MKKKKILIYGWFGHENLGDELILKSIIKTIKDADSNAIINVMGAKPKNIEKYHNGLNNVSTNVDLRFTSIIRTFKYNPFKVVKNLLFNDYLVIGSGGALSDWNPNSTITLFFMINLFKKVLKKPVILLGVGAGPITKEESKSKFRKILERVDFICLRDRESYDLLESIGLKNIKLTNDVVYDLNGCFPQNKNESNVDKSKIAIVVTPLILSTDKKKKDYIDAMINYILELKKSNVDIKLIPFQYDYDIDFLKQIQVKTNTDIYEDGKDDIWGILNELNNYDLVVGMRFHAVVTSILLNIPVLPIIYHAKVSSCVKDFELQSVAQSIGDGSNWINVDINTEKMVSDTLKLLDNKESEKDRLKNILAYKFKNDNLEIIKKFIRN
ncbi:polysaccharide pyruvyl transferase family protein [Clostridium gasigenes]|uniref:polysaccharide pyruvyl transferase family protein n=1 Tax=Clostridium gasigenes TaxID=94869 RepID=UPI001C0C6B83|nr:polysaccharide pyruvyl transferase family protein [Clostridium gasigenes]MBU3138160.1 polysaccharide pyruvyl transferase family protein [Clostridium gasigenes]